VNDQEHQAGIVGEQRRAPQRLHLDHVQVAGHRQVALEIGVLQDLDRAYRDVGVAPHEIQQQVAQVAREALVDELQRLHAPAHHAVGRAQVVGGRAARIVLAARLAVAFARDAGQQRIDFVLRKKRLVGHAYCTTKAVNSASLTYWPSGSGEKGRLTAATMARAMSALPCRLWAAAGDCADSTIRMRLRTSGMYFSMRVRVCSSPARRVMPTCRMRSLSALCRVTVKASSGMKMGAGTAA